jgi:hypothetical protein
MNEELPDPEPSSPEYHRPNESWVCGHDAEGHPCRMGPGRRGECRAGPECAPALEKKEGETKGRWRCTRQGGACAEGPQPDGTCGRPVLRCAPKATLRWWRGRITIAVVAATVGFLLMLLGGRWRGNNINRGTISLAHSSPAFLAFGGETDRNKDTCGRCHVAGDASLPVLVAAAWNADPAPIDFHKLAHGPTGEMTLIDNNCQKCHRDHSMHQANVKVALSCSSCHVEHHGPERMAATADERCVFCHGDVEKLASLTGKTSDAAARTVARDFESAHPSFRVQAERTRDPNTLKFNHALHLGSQTIPLLPGGQKLDCAHCHQPDAAGKYMRRVQFENHCQSCHSLQFDPDAPGLTLPHGNPELVSAFLRSLPKQYTEFAARSGMLKRDEQEKFAREKLARLQHRFSSGDELEKRVFFSNAAASPGTRVGSVSGPAAATYPGCAYCHEVKTGARGQPEVTPPVLPERWLQHGEFDHSRHATMQCVACHDAARSKETSDVILPSRQSCANCHSSGGGVAHSCVTCHSFHSKTGAGPTDQVTLK